MSQWVYFIHAPRENFGATMTPDEQAVWGEHMQLLQRRLDEGSLILAGPTLGQINTGICVFEAPDEDAARAYMEEDPTIASGIARGELRPFRAAYLRRSASGS
ncbi:YciI family protein [Solirubrobacter soli]|uniref:YciI family protein n=1 Tax=Solirubrobacter soli TaxID=363832 RepID=UPI00040A35CD|nr:YciI family protein [Solirubrobacter soli]